METQLSRHQAEAGGSMQRSVRQALADNPDGLTAYQLKARMDRREYQVSNLLVALRSMPDAYIDRWAPRDTNKTMADAVWCICLTPDDAPLPDGYRSVNARRAISKLP